MEHRTPLRRVAPALASWLVAGVGGFLIGTALAWFGRSHEPMFITSTWSYVPAEQWWLHGFLLGLTFVLLLAAIEAALLVTGLLFRKGLLIGGVGLAMVLAGVGLIGLALTAEGLESDQRWMFGAAMGPGFIAFGGLMFVTDARSYLRG